MIEIRQWQNSDSLEELTALLHRAYAQLGAMGLNYTAVDQSVEITARRIQRGTCYVALWDQRLVGTIVVTPPHPDSPCDYYTLSHVAAAHQFAVDPEFQNQGIGVKLLKAAENNARESLFAELALDTAEEAIHLISFYSKLGYFPVSTVHWRGKIYRSIVMTKKL
jgi:GNAT superfamily N-acetyltransferase